MSNKDLINRGRNIALHMKINPDQGYWYETLNELCDSLEQHESKPIIRKGEVYAWKVVNLNNWRYAIATVDLSLGKFGNNSERRKLTANEMPLPEEL